MTKSDQAELPVSRPKTALLGLVGTALGSFLPGVIVAVVSVFVLGYTEKLGPIGNLMVWALIYGFFTAATVAGYLVGLLPLWQVARVKKPSHAFWLAVAASLCSAAAFIAGVSQWIAVQIDAANRETVLVGVVAVLHLILFSAACVLYRQRTNR
jgi:hypothetical protein